MWEKNWGAFTGVPYSPPYQKLGGPHFFLHMGWDLPG